jgi:cytoskeletal protein RodZ
MHDARRIAKLLIVGVIVAFGLTLWGAGRAHANCAEMPSDPMCTGGGMSNPTSPPNTNPPSDGGSSDTPSVNQHSSSPGSHSTSPPVQRPTPTAAPRRTPVTQPSRVVQQPVAAAEDFVPAQAEATVIQPGPAIALSGTAPDGGAGSAGKAGTPPAQPQNSGAGNVLWGFAVGAGFIGIGVGAAATLWPHSGLPGGAPLEAVP